MKYTKHKQAWIMALSMMTLVGCVTMDPTRIDPDIMRYQNWWNFYERGQTRLAAGDMEGAQSDFENALGLRRQAKFSFPEEHWRIRTYGMHFLNSYFPHRELGICYFMQGNLAGATEFLTKSMSMEPSGRAKHYLNQVRMQTLRQQNIPAPVIEIAAASLVKITNARKRTLAGSAQGQGFIRDLQIGDQREFVELAETDRAFEKELTLRSGLNRITVAATDLKGQKGERVVEWIADWDPPVVTITKKQPVPGGWRVEGTCADTLMLSTVSIISDVPQQPEVGGKKSIPVVFELKKGKRVTIRATDTAGNALAATFDEATLALEEQAWLDSQRLTAMAETTTTSDGGFMLAAADDAAAPKADQLKPSLKVSADSSKALDVFREQFFLSGEARDNGGLVSVSINGENMLEQEGALQYHFARLLELDDVDVTNTFEVIAQDAAGNTSKKEFKVVRRNPEFLDDEYRLTLGIPPVAAPEDILNDADTVRVELEDALVEWPARFNLVAREENWDAILTEQKLSVSELSDPRAALQLGKIVTAELFLMGKLIKEASGTTIYVSIVDIDKGRVIAGADVYTEHLDDFRERGFYVSGLARKVEQEFPFVQGQVGAVSDSEVVINVGSQQGVARGMRFVVLERTSEDDTIEDVDVKFFNENWVQLSVKQAKTSEGTADVLPGSAKGAVKTGDFVVSR